MVDVARTGVSNNIDCYDGDNQYHRYSPGTMNKMIDEMHFPPIQSGINPSRLSLLSSTDNNGAPKNTRTIPNRIEALANSRAFMNHMRQMRYNSQIFNGNNSNDGISSIFMQDYGRPNEVIEVENIYDARKFEQQEGEGVFSKPRYGECWKRANEVKEYQKSNGGVLTSASYDVNKSPSLYKNDYQRFSYGRPAIQRPKDSQVLPNTSNKNDSVSTYNTQYMDSSKIISNVYHDASDTATSNMMKNTYASEKSTWPPQVANGKMVSLFKNDFMPPPNGFRSLPALHAPLSKYDPINQLPNDRNKKNASSTTKDTEAQRTFRPIPSDVEPYWMRQEKVKERVNDSNFTHFSMGNEKSQYDTEHKAEFLEFEEE